MRWLYGRIDADEDQSAPPAVVVGLVIFAVCWAVAGIVLAALGSWTR